MASTTATAKTTTRTSARRKPERFVRWLTRIGWGTGLLQIRLKHSETREEVNRYFIAPLASDLGPHAFRLLRWDDATDDTPAQVGAIYDVHLAAGCEQPGTCDCPGFLKHGHCKHHDSLAGMLASDKL